MQKLARWGLAIALVATILLFLVLAHPAEGEKVKQLEAIEMPIYYTVEQEPSKIIETKPKPTSLSISLSEIQEYARSKVDETQWNCLYELWQAESGWEAGRLNTSSSATGIPQALPGTKIYPNFWNMEREWRDGKLYLKYPDPYKEVDWGLSYIEGRYGNACTAYSAFLSRSPHWY